MRRVVRSLVVRGDSSRIKNGTGSDVNDRPLVVCSRALPDTSARERLERIADVHLSATVELFGAWKQADGVVIIRPETLGAAAIAAASNLQVVATVSSGTDHVDTAALHARGIEVVAGTGVAPRPVAEWVVWGILDSRRRFSASSKSFEAGTLDWAQRLPEITGRELGSSTIGIVGFGSVGREVFELIRAFGPRVLVHDPFCTTLASGFELEEDLDRLCDRSDIVTLHVPAADDTQGLIGVRQLELIGPRGLLVNSARGAVVDQCALLEALGSGALGGAILDCFEPEPPAHAEISALAATGRVTVTPHLAGVSQESLAALCHQAVDGIERVLVNQQISDNAQLADFPDRRA